MEKEEKRGKKTTARREKEEEAICFQSIGRFSDREASRDETVNCRKESGRHLVPLHLMTGPSATLFNENTGYPSGAFFQFLFILLFFGPFSS